MGACRVSAAVVRLTGRAIVRAWMRWLMLQVRWCNDGEQFYGHALWFRMSLGACQGLGCFNMIRYGMKWVDRLTTESCGLIAIRFWLAAQLGFVVLKMAFYESQGRFYQGTCHFLITIATFKIHQNLIESFIFIFQRLCNSSSNSSLRFALRQHPGSSVPFLTLSLLPFVSFRTL